MDTVVVETGSRLHFGPLSWKGAGPEFGGLGMMIDQPCTVVSATESDQFDVRGDDHAVSRLSRLFEHWRKLTDRRALIEVRCQASRHQGFGSGTQLACAATAAFLELTGEGCTTEQLIVWSQRGKRSAIGIHGFLQGGFLVDAGRKRGSVGTLATRVEVPSSWVVLLDRSDSEGASGDDEEGAFRRLEPMPADLTGRLCDLTLRSILPGLIDRDFPTFASALTEYGRRAGQFFAAIQGGEFADPFWNERRSAIESVVPAAIVQSSWGPTVSVIVEDVEAAETVKSICNDRRWEQVSPLNNGAQFTPVTDRSIRNAAE